MTTEQQETNTEAVAEETTVDQSTETVEQPEQQEGEQQQAETEEQKVELPETYEFKVPEGMEIDNNFATAMQPVLKDLALTQEQADKLVSVYTEQLNHSQEAQQQAKTLQAEEYVKTLKADKEFGGAAFDSNVSTALSAVNKFASDDVKQVLNETGLGNHPAIVKMFHQIGTAISEDSFSGNSQTEEPKYNYQTLFANSNMNP